MSCDMSRSYRTEEEYMTISSSAKQARPEERPEIDPVDHWDLVMADATAHLLAAFHLLAALDIPPPVNSPGRLSFELAFRNLCRTLIGLDDCCDTVWSSRRTGILTAYNTIAQ
jgi:hypothetical protein